MATTATKTETRYRVRVKTFSGEIKVYPAKIKREASEIFSREVRWDCPEENMYVQLEDSGRERIEYAVVEMCDLTKNGHTDPNKKPVLTDETITYTIVERDEQGKSPFYARVLVPGQEVQDFDPIRRDEWWKHTKSDLVFAINKQYKGAWYLKPEVFDARVAEQQKVETVASEMDIPASEVAKIAVIAQEYKQQKQADRETFEAETKLETVPSYVESITSLTTYAGVSQDDLTAISDGILKIADDMGQDRQVVRVERRSNFSMCGTSWFYAHPECFSIKKILQRDNTDGHRYTTLNHREVGSKATCVECGGSVHEVPIQRQEEIQHMEKQETIIDQIKQTVVASIEHGTIPDGVYVDRRYRDELQKATALVVCGHDINILYEDSDFMEGLSVMAYGIHKLVTQEQEVEDNELSEHGVILLNIMRDATQQGIKIAGVGPILQKHLEVTDDELGEIMEIVKADLRERCISLPGYEQSRLADLLSPEHTK